MGEAKYRELPESEKAVYEKKAEEERVIYEQQLEEYQKEKPPSEEQVMVASQHGFISRIMVDTVPVIDKRTVAKGIRVVKIKSQKDSLSSISLLSAIDDVAEDDLEVKADVKEEVKEEVEDEEEPEPMEEESPPEEKKAMTPKRLA